MGDHDEAASQLATSQPAARYQDLAGLRTLVVGASSGIGEAFAIAASARGAAVALAARRIERLKPLADSLNGFAYELDVSRPPREIEKIVEDAAAALGGLDAVVFTSTFLPFARIHDTDVTTWVHAFSVNAVGASHVLRAALPPPLVVVGDPDRLQSRRRSSTSRGGRCLQCEQGGTGRGAALLAR